MRTFWILIGLLVLAAAAFALLPSLSSGSSKPAMNSPPVAEWPGKQGETTKPSTTSAKEVAAAPVTSANNSSPATNPAPTVNESKKEPKVEAPKQIDAAPVSHVPESGHVAKESAGAPDAGSPSTPATSQSDKIKKDEAVVEDVIEKALNGGASAPVSSPESDKKIELKQTPVRIERKGEDEVLLDGTFTVKGRGTKESPYIVPWELIVLAQETYDPGQDKDEIPGAVMFLDGKYVRLTGYVCFPMYVPEPKEMLSMLNQWDGCCIGVPPTPYDAVEVHLAKKVGTDDRYAVYGVVEGVFRVKPYLSGKWLVGLYLLDESEFKPSDKGGGS
ncbi:MAG: DUF3299 domain-containing protein [Planctomycetes bacterium]|nr:DUF3299 domain-containing protein [Planctomycetota bacterium]